MIAKPVVVTVTVSVVGATRQEQTLLTHEGSLLETTELSQFLLPQVRFLLANTVLVAVAVLHKVNYYFSRSMTPMLTPSERWWKLRQ